MKLLTFLEDGAYRTGILTARPGMPDAVVVDVGGAVELLERQARRITWRTPWRGPWGTLTAPRDMLDVVRHGRRAVVALEDLERTLWHVARTVDGAWAETVCRDPDRITWQPPLPEPPLYLFLSGNTQVMAHQRPPNPPWPVPAPRLRPITALLGHGEPLEADAAGTAGSDMELGVVIGPEAAGPAGVDAGVAMDHVFGYTVCNDAYDRRYQEKADAAAGGAGVSGVRLGGIATCGKASDGCGPVGPVIVTADEVGSPHDLVASAWFNGRLRARAHTSAYAYSVHDAVAHFARLMTLPAGTILAMGACGYDGHAVHGAFRQAGVNRLAVEFERVGRLEHPIAYADDPDRRSTEGQSRYLARRARLGLPDAAQPDLTPGDVPARTRSFWALAENHRPAALPGLPAPYLYPARSLAGGGGPLVLPGHARRLVLSCELAGVAGPRPDPPAGAGGGAAPPARLRRRPLGAGHVPGRLLPRAAVGRHPPLRHLPVPVRRRLQPHRRRHAGGGRVGRARRGAPAAGPGRPGAVGGGRGGPGVGLRGDGGGGRGLDRRRGDPVARGRGVPGARRRHADHPGGAAPGAGHGRRGRDRRAGRGAGGAGRRAGPQQRPVAVAAAQVGGGELSEADGADGRGIRWPWGRDGRARRPSGRCAG